MTHYRSVTSQAIHYLSRPHLNIPQKPIQNSATWKGEDLKNSSSWQYSLSSNQNAEIRQMLRAIEAKKIPTKFLTKKDCPLPTLSKTIQGWAHEIAHGRGFVLVRDFAVEQFTPEECETIFWCLGLHMGTPGMQNSAGDLVTHVLDEGSNNIDVTRLYKTSAAISYHCDAADVVGLLCLQNAKQGGLSRIVSSITVFNEFLKQYPKEVPTLFKNMFMDTKGENNLSYVALPPLRFDGENLRTFYHSDYFRSAKRFTQIKQQVEKYETVLDHYEQIAMRPDLYLEMNLRPGDMQFISNHTIIHARTKYEDTSTGKRHLLRLWISLSENENLHIKALRWIAKIQLLKNLAQARLR